MNIDELSIYTSDPEALSDFYARQFRADIFRKGEVFCIPFGKSTLHLHPGERPACYHFALNIPSDTVESAAEFLRSFTDLLPDPDTGERVIDFTAWNADALYFLDPAGNVVELIARHSLRDKARSAFRPEHIRCISEIGTPVASVQQAFDTLHGDAGIPRYSGNFTSFCAAGDEQGLIILTDRDRTWFPTDIPSRSEPWHLKGSRMGRSVKIAFDGEEIRVVQTGPITKT